AGRVRFHLFRRIPAASGLGGGSSDAAAALRLLRDWWGCVGEHEIEAATLRLGSDVAFFLQGGAQLASGRGELLTPLPDPPPVHLVLLTPPINVPAKTAALYGRLTPAHFTDGARSRRLAEKLRVGKTQSAADYFNVFDGVADEMFPELPDYRRALEDAAGAPALLAGAGPSLFSLCPDAEHAVSTVVELSREGLRARAVTTAGSMRPAWASPRPLRRPFAIPRTPAPRSHLRSACPARSSICTFTPPTAPPTASYARRRWP